MSGAKANERSVSKLNVYRTGSDALGADPVATIEHTLGLWGLRLLLHKGESRWMRALFLPLAVLVGMAAQTGPIALNMNSLFTSVSAPPEKPALPRRFGPGS